MLHPELGNKLASTSCQALYSPGLERKGEGGRGRHCPLEKPQGSVLLPSCLAEPWSYPAV